MNEAELRDRYEVLLRELAAVDPYSPEAKVLRSELFTLLQELNRIYKA